MGKLKSITISLCLGLALVAATSTDLGACAVDDGNPPDCAIGFASWVCSYWKCPTST